MVSPDLPWSVERVRVRRRRAQTTMFLVLAGAGVALMVRVIAPWLSLGLVAGALVLGCVAVCAYAAVADDRAWRGVERDLEQLRRERAGRG